MNKDIKLNNYQNLWYIDLLKVLGFGKVVPLLGALTWNICNWAVRLLPLLRRSYATVQSVCLCVCLSFCLCRITAKVISRFHWNLMLWLCRPIGRTDWLSDGDLVLDTDYRSFFHFFAVADWGMLGDLLAFSYSQFQFQRVWGSFTKTRYINSLLLTYSHRPIFTTLSGMTDADKVINPQHFGSDLIIRQMSRPRLIQKSGFESCITFGWA